MLDSKHKLKVNYRIYSKSVQNSEFVLKHTSKVRLGYNSVDFVLKILKGYKAYTDTNLHPYHLLIKAFKYIELVFCSLPGIFIHLLFRFWLSLVVYHFGWLVVGFSRFFLVLLLVLTDVFSFSFFALFKSVTFISLYDIKICK